MSLAYFPKRFKVRSGAVQLKLFRVWILALTINYIDIFSNSKKKNYLGIILDNQLLFKQHTKMLESKLSHYVGILFKLKSFLPKYILSKIYYAFIHSYLNCDLIIWGATPASNLSKLCRIQNKALRVISGTGWREHAPPLYATQKILQLSKLITYSVAKFMHKFTNKKLPAIFNHFFTTVAKIHSRYTRNSTKPN